MVLKNEIEVTQREIDSKEFFDVKTIDYLKEKIISLNSKQKVGNCLIIIINRLLKMN